MPPFPSFAALLAHLRQAETVPRPEDETWSALIQRITVPGRIHEIDQETYWWFLECLPPRYLSGGVFAFAEGAEPIRLFARDGQRYLVRQLTWEETQAFCGLAGIPLPC